MTDIIIVRGYSGSGKSRTAQEWVDEDPANRVRISRDVIRQLWGVTGKTVLAFDQERRVTEMQEVLVLNAWERGASVIIDDTNLRLRHARRWAELAEKHGRTWAVLDVNTPLEACLQMNQCRPIHEQVPASVIRNQAEKFPQPWPEVVPQAPKEAFAPKPYGPDDIDLGLDHAYIFDIDGTLALNTGGRSPYDMTRVMEDEPNHEVLDLLFDVIASGDRKVVLLSGRDESARALTLSWLYTHVGAYRFHELHMRAEGDGRPDYIVKDEMFEQRIRGKYNIIGVVDDRPSVCRMWRDKGLTVFQVGDPHVEF